MKSFSLSVFLLLNFLLRVIGNHYYFIPKWDDNYYVRAKLTVPEANFEQHFQVWYSKNLKKSRIDINGGIVKSYQSLNENDAWGHEYTIYPVTDWTGKNTNDCIQVIGTADSPISLQPAVYPIEDMFEYEGEVNFLGLTLQKWTRSEDPIGQSFRLHFTFLIHCGPFNEQLLQLPKCAPIRLEMEGRNLLFTSHASNYYIDYYDYKGNMVNEKMLQVKYPACRNLRKIQNETLRKNKFGSGSIDDFLPNLSTLVKEDRGFGDFTRKNGNRFKNEKEFRDRFDSFRRLAEKTKSKKSYRSKLTKFLDLSKINLSKFNKRLRTRLGMKKSNRRKLQSPTSIEYFSYSLEEIEMLKNYTSFNLNSNVGMNSVQSQLTCGSCWAFATAAVLEGTYFVKYGGPRIKLSEQAMIDCSWDFGNYGCFGGRENFALDWAKEYKGVPLSHDYKSYQAINGWCEKQKNETELVRVKKYERIRSGDYKAIQIALIKNGPVLTAMDGSHESMKKYTKGLYYEPNCSSKAEDLDHTVVIVGFGYRGHVLYWIVRNSWSNSWGFNGHILVPAKGNICGLSTSALVVYVE